MTFPKWLKFPDLSGPMKIFIVLVVLVGVVGGSYYAYTTMNHHQQATQPRAAASDQTVPPADTKLPAAPAKNPNADALPFTATNIVHRKEGLESPMIRQLMAHPDLAVNAHVKGVKAFTGDRNDTVALKKWAGVVADIVVRNAGFIGPHFCEEFQIRSPETVAVVILKDSDGSLKIAQYAVHKNAAASGTAGITSTTGTLIATQNVVATSATAHFIGPQDGTTVLPAPYRQFEYMFVPS